MFEIFRVALSKKKTEKKSEKSLGNFLDDYNLFVLFFFQRLSPLLPAVKILQREAIISRVVFHNAADRTQWGRENNNPHDAIFLMTHKFHKKGIKIA